MTIDPAARYSIRIPGRIAPYASMPGAALERYLQRHPEARQHIIRSIRESVQR